MGRPKGSTSKNNANENVMVKSKEDNQKSITSTEKLEQENNQLRNELDEIRKLLLNLTQSQNQQNSQPDYVVRNAEIEEDNFEVKPNKYIKVMSLNFGKLVLTTEGRGIGKVFIFNKFGEVKNIIYSDLANLIHHQQSFAEEGRFYIFDKNVVRNHGLDEYYNKFMTKEMIEKILDNNREQINNLFNNTTPAQQETIVNILINKIVEGEDVDVNKIDIISRLWGENIYDIARDRINEKEV